MKSYEPFLRLFYNSGKLEENYLEKYWLDTEGELEKWESIRKRIFTDAHSLPDMIFQENFELMPLIGGVVFDQEDFEGLKNCMLKVGDTEFVILENAHVKPIIKNEENEPINLPTLCFKFPVSITWDELMGGGMISYELFRVPYRDFYIFGDSGTWGKYFAPEYVDKTIDPIGTPLDIIGFKKELAQLFFGNFEITNEEKQRAISYLPSAYKKKVSELMK